jgi:hypothetical protein
MMARAMIVSFVSFQRSDEPPVVLSQVFLLAVIVGFLQPTCEVSVQVFLLLDPHAVNDAWAASGGPVKGHAEHSHPEQAPV